MITVNFYAAAKASVGTSTIYIESNSFKNILEKIKTDYPNINKVLPTCTFLLDGNLVKDFEIMVNNCSNLDILPTFAGG